MSFGSRITADTVTRPLRLDRRPRVGPRGSAPNTYEAGVRTNYPNGTEPHARTSTPSCGSARHEPMTDEHNGRGPALTDYGEDDLPQALDGSEDEYVPRSPQDPVAIPYDRINPPDIPYTDFNYAQRRSVILERIERVGHPRGMEQTYAQLADEFDTTKSQIHQDMKVLAAFMAENVSRDHVTIMDAVFRGAVRDLADDGEWVEAAEVGKGWYEWLADMGAVDRVADKVDLNATVRNPSESDSYRVIDDDDVLVDSSTSAGGGDAPDDAEAVEYVENTADDAESEADNDA